MDNGNNEVAAKGNKESFAFAEGVYALRFPLSFVMKPKLNLVYNKGNSKAKGEISIFGQKKKLKLVEHHDNQFVFVLQIDSIMIDLVIRFYKKDAFEGFVDTPIGHIFLSGRYLNGR
ncbi:MAG: hypothetical protein WBV27_03015 [Trichococcus sp.]|uniref:hypothetical protein n=1 Tax=Trichococcus sp. TaxID=1985464 RepID=UPI003C33E168